MPSTPATTPVDSANSYATIAEANTYLDDSIRAGSWEFLDDDTKARCLLTATVLAELPTLLQPPLEGTARPHTRFLCHIVSPFDGSVQSRMRRQELLY